MKTIAIFGYGQRGAIYASYAVAHPQEFKLVAIIENNQARIMEAKRNCKGVPVFERYEDFLKMRYTVDLVVICTQDAQHREHAVAMMNAGYDLLLEKPIANNPEDCLSIYRTCKRLGRKVLVCHVLRYTPFYSAIKKIIKAGELGDIVSIHASENVGYFHYAHSYVRGPWRRSDESSPMILAKCCHDMDIFCWLLSRKCVSVASYGSLSFYKQENAPKGSAEFCSECALKECPYRAQELYTSPDPVRNQFARYFCARGQSEENILADLRKTQYDRCVFRSDNDVVDHQVTIMEFEKGSTVCHTMTAFSQEIYRDIKIYGTKAELFGHMEHNLIEVRPFGAPSRQVIPELPQNAVGGHCGGDEEMMRSIYRVLCGQEDDSVSYLDVSVESHLMAFAAEQSRLNGGCVQIDDLKN